MIEIIDNQKDDQVTVTEMNHRAVVPMDSVEIIKHGPKPKIDDDDTEK